MKKVFQSLPVSFAPYRLSIYGVVFFHLLAALFTVVSIPMIIPFFHILFQSSETPNPNSNVSGLELHLQEFVQQMVSTAGQQKAILWICLVFIALFFFKNLFRYFAMFFMTPVRNGLIRDLRQHVFDQYQRLPVSYLKSHPKGNLLSILMTDVQEAEWMFRNSLETLIKSPLIIFGCIVFMLYLDVRLTAFVFILLLFTVLVIGGVSRALKRESKEAQDQLGHLHTIGDESLTAFPVIRSLGAEDHIGRQFATKNNRYKNLYDKVLRRRDLASPLSEFLGVSIVALLLWYGSGKVFEQALSPEAFFAFLFAFFQIIEPAKSFATSFFTIQKGMGAVDRINEVMQVDETNRFLGKDKLSGFQGRLEFKDLHFSYEEGGRLLSGVNAVIPKGSIISIEGPSGIGKSTLVQLILRFFDPSKGSILVDGKHIKSYNIQSYRQLFGYVDQQLNLFHDTIAENIAFGSDDKSDKRIRKAARDAYADSFIGELVNGYDTVIGEQGLKLSGGQRQRLALARAFYHEADILILDEATSSIDSKSKTLIMKALQEKNEKDQTTIIIISHQDELKEIAHTRYVIQDGTLLKINS